MSAQYEFFLASPLEKVFPLQRPAALDENAVLYAFPGCRTAVQLVSRGERLPCPAVRQTFSVTCSGGPCPAQIHQVLPVSSDFPCFESSQEDENYLTHQPGLFPDLLAPLDVSRIRPLPGQYRAFWLSWKIPADAPPGRYPVEIVLQADDPVPLGNGTVFSDPDASPRRCVLRLILHIAAQPLPPQKLLHTEWLHADCLASYYQVPVFSEEHWAILENFIRFAADSGVNLLLTPVFTPPLDTAVNGERPTVQLVDIIWENGAYSFEFSKLSRWAAMCRRCGVEYLEIAHLFTQWGARAAPKIMGRRDGREVRLFGWDTPAESPRYLAFLQALLPALQRQLEADGFDREHVYYHISDEPSAAYEQSYAAARRQVEDLLDGCPVIDALSDFSFYEKGLVPCPVVAEDCLSPFLEAQVPSLWTYYCGAQDTQVPNRFFAMPSARTRILGVLLYLYRIRGFLHWGYNFYYSQYSRRALDPYAVTHADYAFPSGDAYLVYPGPDGVPLSSLRAEAMAEAMVDLRGLELLESLTGRGHVEALIRRLSPVWPITFAQYPRGNSFLESLRQEVVLGVDAAR